MDAQRSYKYCVYDNGNQIKDKCFDDFAEAFDYAQDGLITFIEEVPYIDGHEVEEESEIVWSWDDTWDRDEAIERVEGRHDSWDAPITESIKDVIVTSSDEHIEGVEQCKDRWYSYLYIQHPTLGEFYVSAGTHGDIRVDGKPWRFLTSDKAYKLTPQQENWVLANQKKLSNFIASGRVRTVFNEDLSVEVKSDDPEELADFARCVLGDNCEFFDQDFETDEVIPAAELDTSIDEPKFNKHQPVVDLEDEPLTEAGGFIDKARAAVKPEALMDKLYKTYTVIPLDKNKNAINADGLKNIRTFKEAVAKAKTLSQQHAYCRIWGQEPQAQFANAKLDSKPLDNRMLQSYYRGTVERDMDDLSEFAKLYLSLVKDKKAHGSDPLDDPQPETDEPATPTTETLATADPKPEATSTPTTPAETPKSTSTPTAETTTEPKTTGTPLPAKSVSQKQAANAKIAEVMKSLGIADDVINKLKAPTGNKKISGLGMIRKALLGESLEDEEIERFDDFDTQIQADELISPEYEDDDMSDEEFYEAFGKALKEKRDALIDEGVSLDVEYDPADPDVGIMRDNYYVSGADVTSDFSGKRLDKSAYIPEGEDVEQAAAGTLEEWEEDLKKRSIRFGDPDYKEALKKCIPNFYNYNGKSLEDVFDELSTDPETATIVEYERADTGESVYLLPDVWEVEADNLGLISVDSAIERLDSDYFERKNEPDWDIMPGGHDDY